MRALALMAAFALAAPLPPAIAAPSSSSALKQLHAEMAAARKELATGDLKLRSKPVVSLGSKQRASVEDDLPEAVITPTGQLMIEGQVVPTSPQQRALLNQYRQQLVSVGLAGIDIGERAAGLALEAVDMPLLSLLASAFTGGLEKKLETRLKNDMAPLVLQLCDRLPAVLSAQDTLAAELVQFRPYAGLKTDDVANCRQEVQSSLDAA